VLIFLLFSAYAILRFQLFNIKIIAVEASVIILGIFLAANIFFAESFNEMIANSVLFVLTVILGTFLSRAVRKEVKQRKRLKKLTRELHNVNRDLESLDRQKTEFVSLASHQLRTPLTSMKGYASMLLEGSFGDLKGGAREAVRDVYKQSQALSRAVENILVVSRLEQGRVDYDFEKIDFYTIANEVYETWFDQAHEKGLEMSFSASGQSGYEVFGDKEKIRQVLETLVENGLEYTEEGFVRLLLTRDTARERVRFSVSDTGMGMSEEQIREAFAGYPNKEEVKEPTSYETQPNMALYITREFIKAHEGRIWADSPGKGRGSTFFVEIPFYDQSDEDEGSTDNTL
jgi:signal transduction histidine kinase